MKKKRPAPTQGYLTRALVAEDPPVIPRKRKRVYRRRDMRAKA